MITLRYYGDPLLRKKAKEIAAVDSTHRELIEQMEKVMDRHRGCGLAAPQVGHSIRLFIMRIDREVDGETVKGKLRVFINPVLTEPSDQTDVMKEGCLSLPGFREDVERPHTITVEALDEEGKPFKQHLTGLAARIVMHENDHLNGVLFIDRISPKRRKAVEPILKNIKKKHAS